MGITGLLPFLEKASEPINIRSLANKSVAIDAYCWLHKGAFGVGDKLARGEQTDGHILYCLKYVNMLLSHNIKPILVFDGRHLPAKADTEAKRRESRQTAKQRAMELMRKGNHSEASKYLRRCVDITHEMALQLIQCCRAINVDSIVAPYESDAELAYLNKIGLADYVITEDSDLTLFGCRKILFKLDLNGNCVLVDADKFHLAMDCRKEKFSMDKFRLMCVLSGCDYVNSLNGIGLVKACKFVMKTEETDLMRALDKIPAYLNMRQLIITDEYKISVIKAIATFLHMVVFDPRYRKQVRLNEIDEIGTDEQYCTNAGVILEGEQALQLAVGNLNPFTMKELDNWHPDQRTKCVAPKINMKGLKIAKHPSIWTRDYRWNITQQSNNVEPVQVSIESTVKRQSKRSIQATNIVNNEIDISENDTENDDNLLNEYSQIAAPSKKRFKDDIEDSSDDEVQNKPKIEQLLLSPIRNRNPFKKPEQTNNELMSPTEITKENNSLIKNQSPVKRIDYRRLEKLSRFSRTIVTQQNVSKFFKQVSKDSHPSESNPDNIKDEENLKNEMETETITESDVAVRVHFTESVDSAISDRDDVSDMKTDETPKTAMIFEKFKFNYNRMVLDEDKNETIDAFPNSQDSSNKTDISDVSDIPIMISDESNDAETDTISASQSSSSRSSSITTSQKSNTAMRGVGLKRKNPPTKTLKKSTNKDSTKQSKLSMFGFQPKAQLQP